MPGRTRTPTKSTDSNPTPSLTIVASRAAPASSWPINRPRLIAVPSTKIAIESTAITGALARLVAAYNQADSRAKDDLVLMAEALSEAYSATTPVKLGLVEPSGCVRAYARPNTRLTDKVKKADALPTTPSGEPLALCWETPGEQDLLTLLRQGLVDQAVRLIRGNRQPVLAHVSPLFPGKGKPSRVRRARSAAPVASTTSASATTTKQLDFV